MCKELVPREDPARGLDDCGEGCQSQVAGMVGGTMLVGRPEDVLRALIQDEEFNALLEGTILGDTGRLLKAYYESEKVLADFLLWLDGAALDPTSNKMFEKHDAVLAHMYTRVAMKQGEPLTAKLGMDDVRGLMFSAAAYIWWAQNVKGTMPGKL